MKKSVIILGALALFSAMYLGGCSDSSGKPSRALVESEFRHAWHAIHGEKGEKGFHWILEKIKVGSIDLESDGKVARVNITYGYEAYGKSRTKTIRFKYLKVGDTWQIEDREGRDHSSIVGYNMTP